MKQRIIALIFSGLLFLTLTGCQKGQLEKANETFTADDSEYSFKLPKGWKVEKEYKETFNEAAVFGAEDSNSRSEMFVRAQPSKPLDEQELKQETKESLLAFYKLEAGEVESFDVDGLPAIHYLMPSVYKKKAVWLDMYFVTTKTHLVNFQFYRPRDNSAEKQKQVIYESVKTLKQLRGSQTLTSSSQQKGAKNNQKLENQRVAIQLTGNKIVGNQLILRYVITNKTSEDLIPVDEWQQMFSVTEAGEHLAITEQPKADDTELDYLLKQNKQRLPANESIESAVVYTLQPEGTITIRVNEGQVNSDEPMSLTIER
ncbi:hypothetical protein IGJ55_000294 [Enterococcus sp. AZ170]|uniref:DUF5067 domain-containing protein n=1 Tax=Enterococcus TaxID=1350 RepID=UPI001A92F683|nr:DUF5067 domain-containing protein [Enterococcus ureilyticus]MBO0445105.1 DUF5067 domain-containing protein [Enterococcus ureilyticus]